MVERNFEESIYWKVARKLSHVLWYVYNTLYRTTSTYHALGTHLRKPIFVEKQVSIVLYYYLSDEGRIRKVVNSFWVGKSTVSLVAGRATKAISEYMPKKYIVCPNTESVLKKWFPIFKETDRFPQCIGVVDRTHVGIKKPKDVSSSDFVNRKDFIL